MIDEDKKRLFNTYTGMKRRCYEETNINYKRYGGKGIGVCDEWLEGGIDVFRAWAMSNGYQPQLTIDRLDSEGDYSPQNCRWATVRQQNDGRKFKSKSSYKGVQIGCKQSNRPWRSQIWINKRYEALGTFTCELEAAAAFDIAIISKKLDRSTNYDLRNYSEEDKMWLEENLLDYWNSRVNG